MSSIAPGAAGSIFVSYRRSDAAYPAGWLFDLLIDRYGRDRVFKDVDSISPGENFAEVITTAVQSCAVLLAVIGRRWLGAADEDGGTRLDDRGDFVRLEIEMALERNVRVIPVLVDEARMPQASQLPPSLRPLAGRHAIELGPSRFRADSQRLLNVLDTALATAVPQSRAAKPASAPDITSRASVLSHLKLPSLRATGDSGSGVNRDEVAERQAQVSADLQEAQKKYTEMSKDPWLSRRLEQRQRSWPELMRMAGRKDMPEVSHDDLFGGDPPAPGSEPQPT